MFPANFVTVTFYSNIWRVPSLSENASMLYKFGENVWVSSTFQDTESTMFGVHAQTGQKHYAYNHHTWDRGIKIQHSLTNSSQTYMDIFRSKTCPGWRVWIRQPRTGRRTGMSCGRLSCYFNRLLVGTFSETHDTDRPVRRIATTPNKHMHSHYKNKFFTDYYW